jgi:hypothetical protein
MIRTLNILLVISAIGTLIAVYALKYASEDIAAERVSLQRTIERQQSDLSLLKADWAFLNQPANVAPIVTRHTAELNLQTLSQDQFGTFTSLPMRMKQPDAQALDSLFESLNSGVDPIQQLISESN